MGLLERALQYKQKINETGKETLIDRIKGPAETDHAKEINIKKIDISEIDQIENHDNELQIKSEKDEVFVETNINVKSEIAKLEEDIILFDENDLFLKDPEQGISIQSAPDKFEEKKIENIRNEEYIFTEDAFESEEVDPAELDIHENIVETEFSGIPEFNDYGTLYEIQKEFIKADTIEEVFSTILFSIMGQLGVSSVSIIAPSLDDYKKWKIIDSHGIKISDNNLFWEIEEGILKVLDTYKSVLDIEDIKNDTNLRDDYYKFTAVDARIITPLIKDQMLVGAVLVGEKIDSENFTPVELEFLRALSEISSSIIESLSKHEKTTTELLGLRIEKEILSDVEFFQDSLLNISSLNELSEVIRKNFYSLGLESYSIFMRDTAGGDYYPAYFELDDMLGFSDSGFRIKKDNQLVTFLVNKKASIILENFNESNVVVDTFGRNRIIKMELFIAYPFIISGNLSGFITIFKINPAVDIIDIDIRIQKMNRFLFPYLYRVYELDPELNKYSDLTASFYEKIENELKHSREMNIPLSLVLLTIKNYKRFNDRFGKIELEKLNHFTSEIIKSKLSVGDHSARIDRNKYLLVLPGKEKRYSVMLSNAIKNEVIDKYNMSDFKILVTSLISVFPEDGNDLFSILEVLE